MRNRFLLLILVVVMVFTGCQPTPEEPIVKSKTKDTFIDVIKEQPIESTTDAPATKKINKFEGYRSEWQDSVKVKNYNINVNIDAKICVPDTDKLPVYEVSLKKFTQEQVDGFLSQFGDVEYHLALRFKTKEDYWKEILKMKEYLAVELPNKDISESKREKLRNEFESGIEKTTQKMNEAPESINTKVEPVFTNKYIIAHCEQNSSGDDEEQTSSQEQEEPMTAKEYYESTKTENINVEWEKDNKNMVFEVSRSNTTFQNVFRYKINKYPKSFNRFEMDVIVENLADINELNVTFNKAKALADDEVNHMGIDYYTMSHSAKNDFGYIFFYTRNINEVNDTYCCNGQRHYDRYDEPWQYEYLKITVNEMGVWEIYLRSSQTELGNMISEDSILLPIEEIMNIAKSQFEIGNISFDSPMSDDYDRIINLDLDINEIRLGYMRVKLSDNSGKYVMIPVWDFFGSYKGESTYKDGTSCELSSDIRGYRNSYLTINAIDGSIIDRSLGY